MKKYAGMAAIVTAVCGFGSTGFADILVMTDGTRQVGVIVSAKTDNSRVTIRTTGGEITIPRSKVTRVEEHSPAVSYGLLGDEFLKAGNFDKAIETYEAGLEFDGNKVDLRQKLQQARGGISMQTAETQQALDARARRVIDQAMQLARGGNFENAYNTMRSVEPPDTSPLRAEYNKSVVQLFMQWGQHMLDRQNTGGAAEKFNEVLKLDPENARAKELLIKTFEGDPTKLEETARFYIQSADAEEQLKGAEALFKLQRYEDALAIYLRHMGTPALNSQYNITQRLQSILDTLHQQYASRGDYRKALEYFSTYVQVKPDADPMPYSRYLYMIKRSETDMNIPAQRLELATFAEEVGLIPTAKEEYKSIISMDPESTGALTALRRYAESDLADAREFVAQNEFMLAAQKAQELVAEYPMYPELIAQANQIQASAQVEAQKLAQNAKANARALAERGDNYYNQAMQYLGAYASTEIRQDVRIFSPRNEAAKFLGQAVFSWRTALQMDPTLGDPTTYNLHFKIRDAQAKYNAVANRRPPRLPPRIRNN